MDIYTELEVQCEWLSGREREGSEGGARQRERKRKIDISSHPRLSSSGFMLRRLLGVRTEGKEKQTKVAKLTKGSSLSSSPLLSPPPVPSFLKSWPPLLTLLPALVFIFGFGLTGEVLLVNIGATASGARVVSVKADMAKIVLQSPVCTEVDEKIALSRRIDKHWRLIGTFSSSLFFLTRSRRLLGAWSNRNETGDAKKNDTDLRFGFIFVFFCRMGKGPTWCDSGRYSRHLKRGKRKG